MGLIPSRATQHLLNGAALSHMQASHKWVGASWWGESPVLTSHQIRFRPSGHHHKGLIGKHSQMNTILWIRKRCTCGCPRALLHVCRELMHALVSPQCAFALITRGMWQRHSRSNREIKDCVCLKEFQLCGRRNVSVQYFPLSQKCFISCSGLRRAYLTQTHILVRKLTFEYVFDFFVFTLSRCQLLSCFFSFIISESSNIKQNETMNNNAFCISINVISQFMLNLAFHPVFLFSRPGLLNASDPGYPWLADSWPATSLPVNSSSGGPNDLSNFGRGGECPGAVTLKKKTIRDKRWWPALLSVLPELLLFFMYIFAYSIGVWMYIYISRQRIARALTAGPPLSRGWVMVNSPS